ncbi:hypothetical protein BH09VER1_BH09VER1_25220 [soil metagenome]
MSCQLCRIDAPTKRVIFYQNVGAIFLRFSKTMDARLCKNCIHKRFWHMTAITLFWGWWGLISMIVTPFFLINNIVRYLGCMSLPVVPPEAKVLEHNYTSPVKLMPRQLANRKRPGTEDY